MSVTLFKLQILQGADDVSPKILLSPDQDLKSIPTECPHPQSSHWGENGLQNEEILWSGGLTNSHMLTISAVSSCPSSLKNYYRLNHTSI